MKKKAVILANGLFPTNEKVLKILKEADFLICCDGAITYLDYYNIRPNVIVGDLDSIDSYLMEKYKNLIIQIDEQESNDLTKAFSFAIDNAFINVDILGATGKRDDHTLANLSLLYSYNKKAQTSIITDYGVWSVIDKTSVMTSHVGQQVSLFSNNPCAKFYSEDLKYPLSGMLLDELWKGSLNESMAESFTIKFEKAQVLIFREFV